MSTKNKGRDYSTVLIWSAACVTVIRYSAAFIASDIGEITGLLSEAITILMGLSGIGMGVLDVIGGTYLFDGWRHAMPASGKAWSFRFKILTAFVLLLIVSGIAILTPFTVSRVTHQSLAVILESGSLTWWALLVNATPYFLIGGVAIGQKMIADIQTNTSEPKANSSPNGSPETNESNGGSRKFNSLSQSEKYFILNEKSETAAASFGVTQRAVQKWRLRIQDEVSQGKL